MCLTLWVYTIFWKQCENKNSGIIQEGIMHQGYTETFISEVKKRFLFFDLKDFSTENKRTPKTPETN